MVNSSKWCKRCSGLEVVKGGITELGRSYDSIRSARHENAITTPCPECQHIPHDLNPVDNAVECKRCRQRWHDENELLDSGDCPFPHRPKKCTDCGMWNAHSIYCWEYLRGARLTREGRRI